MQVLHFTALTLLLSLTPFVSLQAEDYAKAPALDPVNFERIKMVDQTGDSFVAPSESSMQYQIAEEVAQLVRAERFAEAARVAARDQDPVVRRRLSLGIINVLCQQENFGSAIDIASYRISDQDIKALALLMVAVKQAELKMESAEINHAKALAVAQKIEDEETRRAITNFIAATKIQVSKL